MGPLEAAATTRALAREAEALLEARAAAPHPPIAFARECLEVGGLDLSGAGAPASHKVPIHRGAFVATEAPADSDRSAPEPLPLPEEGGFIHLPIWQTDPLLDLYQGFHDRLYSRLFLS